jgi:inorganic pyrophosphatase
MGGVNVVIEIAKNSHIKYEYDKERNMIMCDRILHTPMKYPFNYGFIPDTLSEDGDPLDVVVLMDDKLVPGCMIRCEILGYLDTKDDEGNDPKMIVCPVEKVDPMWKDVDDLFNINEHANDNDKTKTNKSKINTHTLTRIKYFFEHYKDLENKKVYVGDFHSREDALKVYEESITRFKINAVLSSKTVDTEFSEFFIQKTKITDFFKRI